MSNPLAVSILDKLTSWYTFDDTIADAHGTNDLTANVFTGYAVDGKRGSYLLPGNKLNKELLPNVPVTPTTGLLTIGGWLKFTNAVGSAAEFGFTYQLNAGNSEAHYIYVDVDSRIRTVNWYGGSTVFGAKQDRDRYVTYNMLIQMEDSNGTMTTSDQSIKVAASDGVTPGWVFVVATSENGRVLLYVDGQVAAEYEGPPPSLNGSDIEYFQIGHNGYYTNVSGQDEVFFATDAVFSAEEIEYLYNKGIGMSYSDVTLDAI